MGKSTSDYSTELITRDNSCEGLVTAARADVKKVWAVYRVRLEQDNLLFTIGQFLGPIPKK